MTGFETFRLPSIPEHMHFPHACEPYIARLLGGMVRTEAEQWPEQVNADYVLQGLEWHGIGPILYHRSKLCGELDTLPSWLQSYLRRAYLRSTAMNLAISAELLELLDALAEHGIPVILLKGSALMRGAYEQIGLRPMVDVDLLVRDRELDRVRDVLCRKRYREKAARKQFENEHHLQFVRTGRRDARLLVELHWRLSDQKELAHLLPLADLWGRSVPAPPPWSSARVFDPCDQILHAALHLAEHYGFPQLRWLCDLHELSWRIARDEAWPTLAQRAVQYNLHLVLAASFQAMQRWFGTDVDDCFWQELAAGLPPSRAAERAFAQCKQPALVAFELQELRSIPTLRGRMAHILALLFPDAGFIRRRHRVPRGSAVWPYYLLRLGTGFCTGVRSMFHGSAAVQRPVEHRENETPN